MAVSDITDEVTTLTGRVECKSMLPAVLPAARAVDGVVDVESQLSYEIDDNRLSAPPALHPIDTGGWNRSWGTTVLRFAS